MNPAHQEIFDAALEITEPLERNALLDRACAGDPQLRRQMEELLAAHAKAEGFFSDCISAMSGRPPLNDGAPDTME